MNAETARATAEAEVRTALDHWQNAVRAKDIDAIVSHYASDIVAYDAILKLQFKGVDVYRKHWETCMEMCSGPMIFELHELQVVSGEDVALSPALTRRRGPGPDANAIPRWMRLTACYRKRNEKWQVVHEHFSAPFDMESSKVLWLEP